jgi:trehalose 6-phosphate synthase/trehalose 6-phosphate phosphatase
MNTSIELSIRRSVPGLDLSGMQSSLQSLFEAVSIAPRSTLLLDFDGTLAPFRVDPASVRPWAGVIDLLEEIQRTKRTQMTIISGRPAQDVARRLALREQPEIWGLHGAERLYPDGTLVTQTVRFAERAMLDDARSELLKANLSFRIEEKQNSVGVHWRGMTTSGNATESLEGAKERAAKVLQPFGDVPGLFLLNFDGGLELRAGRNKGEAVRLILKELPAESPVTYLGDDDTDEDAFRALGNRGISVLVRRKWRPSAAHVWLRPPVQLRRFLKDWILASKF